MARILARVLQHFGDLYRADDIKSGPEFVELGGSVMPVHDVGRMVEINSLEITSVGGGFWDLTIPTTHAGATTVTGSKDVFAELAQLAPHNVVDLDTYLLDCGAHSADSAVLITTAGLGITLPATFPTAGTPVEGYPLALVATTAGTIFFDGGAGTYGAQRSTGIPDARVMSLPLFVPRGAILTTRVTSGAAATMQSWFRLWSGYKGARPPGVA